MKCSAVGEVIVHPRLGRGTVKSRTDSALEIVFADCVRKLAIVRPELGAGCDTGRRS